MTVKIYSSPTVLEISEETLKAVKSLTKEQIIKHMFDNLQEQTTVSQYNCRFPALQLGSLKLYIYVHYVLWSKREEHAISHLKCINKKELDYALKSPDFRVELGNFSTYGESDLDTIVKNVKKLASSEFIDEEEFFTNA